MDIRRGLVPAAVVVQADHPQAQGEQADEDDGHPPMQNDADQTEAGRGVTPLHEMNPWKHGPGKYG
ncbi:hypothetical protein D9M73_290170 [compost metagenome]